MVRPRKIVTKKRHPVTYLLSSVRTKGYTKYAKLCCLGLKRVASHP